MASKTVFLVRERFEGETCLSVHATRKGARQAVEDKRKEYDNVRWERTENGWESTGGTYSLTYEEQRVRE